MTTPLNREMVPGGAGRVVSTHIEYPIIQCGDSHHYLLLSPNTQHDRRLIASVTSTTMPGREADMDAFSLKCLQIVQMLPLPIR